MSSERRQSPECLATGKTRRYSHWDSAPFGRPDRSEAGPSTTPVWEAAGRRRRSTTRAEAIKTHIKTAACVIRTGATPEARGLNQLLPVANTICGLATFENLHNSVSSADGLETLVLALKHYVLLYPN